MRTLRAHQNNQECYECAENPAERSLGFGAKLLQQVGELQAERRPEGPYPPSPKDTFSPRPCRLRTRTC